MCLLEQGASRKIIKIEKNAAEHMVGTFQKSCSKRCSGLLRFWHEVRRGARRIKNLTPKKNCINSAGAFFRHMRAPKNRNREDEAEKIQRKISENLKKIGRDIFQKPFFNAFFAFSEEFIFFILQFF